jgi:hypothetical protein
MNTMMTAIAISSTTVFLVVSSWNAMAVAAGADAPHPSKAQEMASDRRAETRRILSTLDRKVADPTVRRRAAEKLVMLSNGQVHLIASLAERLAVDGDGPAAGIALLLITALLIVS